MTLGKSLHMHHEQSPHPRVDLRGVRAANANGCKGRGQGSGGALALRLLGALRSFGYYPQNRGGGPGGTEKAGLHRLLWQMQKVYFGLRSSLPRKEVILCVFFFSFSCHQAFYFRKGKCPIRWIFRLSCGVVLGFLSMKQFWRRSTLSVREVARFALVGFFWLGFSLEPSAK